MSKKDETIRLLHEYEIEEGYYISLHNCEDLATKIEKMFDKEKVISEFVAEVEKRAEEKMLRTGKLEGAHYAAMKQLLWELREQNSKNEERSSS